MNGKYYRVSFQYSETTYCSNIAHAESIQAVYDHYNKYSWVNVEEATESDVQEAERKGKPIVEIESTPDEAETASTAGQPETDEAEIMTTAERIYNLDIFGNRDNDITPERIKTFIESDPIETIIYLLDMIDDMQV